MSELYSPGIIVGLLHSWRVSFNCSKIDKSRDPSIEGYSNSVLIPVVAETALSK